MNTGATKSRLVQNSYFTAVTVLCWELPMILTESTNEVTVL